MHAAGTQGLQTISCSEEQLERSGPADRLVEEKVLGWTPARDENPVQPLTPATNITAALAIGVYFEPRVAFELRERRLVHTHIDVPARREHVAAREAPNPQARSQFGGNKRQRDRQEESRQS